ncbi:RNA polymerase sigma factor [Flavivirga algicola]|uniref:RNA polymerase sigma factor n=1 Tax=Flavivirga algicola TaxID=2729136 RepID=A0ABX1RVY6_9FLAO|nr:RNA polymerase sigma factor [Flavivirga algicola]NMH86602.1 RNA polymerase sigma factor [Flavivirga algicola]
MNISESEFEKLFKENQPKLKSFIYRLITNNEDVDDLCQETFIKAYKNIDAFNGNSTFKTWLFAIANNLIKDHFKAQKRWARNAQDNCSQSIKNSTELQNKTMNLYAAGRFEIKNHIDYCFTCVMKYLPLERQIAIMLADIYEFKVSEISQIMNKTVGSVKHLLLNGRNTMKKVFDEDCTLIHKTGACWKCSELSNSGNTKAKTQQKIAKLGMVKAKNKGANRTKLYELRTQLIKAINPLNSSSFELHNFLINQTDFANNKNYPRIDKECGE